MDQESVAQLGVEELGLSDACPITLSLSRHAATTRKRNLDMHYALEIGIVLDGAMRRWVGGESVRLTQGDVWLCGMWEVHGYTVQRAPCDVLVFIVWPPLLMDLHFAEAPDVSWLAPFARPYRQRLGTPKQTLRAEFLALAQRIVTRLGSGYTSRDDPNYRLAVRLALMEVLFELRRHVPESFCGGDAPSASKEAIAPALELALSARRLVTVQDAARACGLSRDRFVRHFRGLMGMHFAPFALYRRLGGAAREMVASDKPIKAIACDWGFTDESHLHRHFRRHYGASPAAYRRNHRANPMHAGTGPTAPGVQAVRQNPPRFEGPPVTETPTGSQRSFQ